MSENFVFDQSRINTMNIFRKHTEFVSLFSAQLKETIESVKPKIIKER